MKITTEMTKAAYSISKDVYKGTISKEGALDHLESDYGMNRNSAADYVNNFQHMMDGVQYTRTNNGEATEYFLRNIHADYGPSRLRNALSAVDQHINYYEGLGRGNLTGIRNIFDKYTSILNAQAQTGTLYPDEISSSEQLFEGAKKTVTVNSYERNPQARSRCIEHYGVQCFVCSFEFQQSYFEIGEGFIHVHHLTQLSNIGRGYEVDPIRELRPVCPNCHAMLHRRNPPYTIEELKSKMKNT